MRKERNNIIKFLLKNKKINLEHVSIQTFDSKLMTWLIFKDNHNLRLIDGTLTIRDNSFGKLTICPTPNGDNN